MAIELATRKEVTASAEAARVEAVNEAKQYADEKLGSLDTGFSQTLEVANYEASSGGLNNNIPTSNDGFTGAHHVGGGIVLFSRRNYPDADHCMYRTTDFGQTILPVTVNGASPGSTGKHGYIAGSNGARCFFGTGDEGNATLFRSDDYGHTWSVALTTAQIATLCGTTASNIASIFTVIHLGSGEWLAILRNNVAYSTSKRVLLKSTDNGETWSAVAHTGLLGSARSVNVMSNGWLLASVPNFASGDTQGLYISEDKGINWRRAATFAAFGNPTELGDGVWAVGDLARSAPWQVSVYVSNDYGETWRAALATTGTGLCYFRYIHRVIDGVAYAYLSCSEVGRGARQCRQFFTTDFGEAWEDQGIVPGGDSGSTNAIYYGVQAGSYHLLAAQPDQLILKTKQSNPRDAAMGLVQFDLRRLTRV